MRFLISRVSPALLVVTILVLGLVGARSDAGATKYHMTMSFEVADTTAGAHSDVTTHLSIPGGDSIFNSIITFLPSAWGFASCPAGNPAAASRTCADQVIADGTVVGNVLSHPTLGLLNGPCNTPLELPFTLLDATTDQSQTVVFHDTDGDGVGQQFQDDNHDGLANGVQMYPDYLLRLIRTAPYPGGDPLQPIERQYAQTKVGGTWVSLQFLVFQPGITVNGLPLDESLGYPSIFVLQNTSDPGAVAEPSSISDFCTPHSSDWTVYGMTRDNPNATPLIKGGAPFLTNPGNGGYNLTGFVPSEYDADGDGIENPLDTCPISGNPDNWDPRALNSPGDADNDGIPNVCDPKPNEDVGPGDADGDGFMNRDDNCPTVANPDQADIDRDKIGDACDPQPLVPSGHQHLACGVTEIDIGAGGTPAVNPLTVPPCALIPHILFGDVNCSGAVDAIDALFVLRFAANIQPAALCIDVADVNCDMNVDAVDALELLRFAAGLSVTQQPGCPTIGQPT